MPDRWVSMTPAGRAPMRGRLVEIETNRRCVGAPAAEVSEKRLKNKKHKHTSRASSHARPVGF